MNTLNKFSTFIKELAENNSRNYKLSVLDKYKEDEDIKYYLEFIFNPYKITGISDKKLSMIKLEKHHYDSFLIIANQLSIKELLEYVLKHNTGRLEDLDYIASNINGLDEELIDLIGKILTKNIQLGIDAKSINKVIPNLIPQFSVQLANKYFEKPEYVEGKTFAITTKIDGSRIIAIKENGVISFYTRQGQPYDGLVDLEKEMQERLPDNICLDGELTLLDKGDLKSGDQYKAAMKISRKDGEKHGLKMLVFDCMTAEEFRNQKCNTTYAKRYTNLVLYFLSKFEDKTNDYFDICPENISNNNYVEKSVITNINKEYKYFSILPILYHGKDANKITELLNYNVAKGEEGIMINICDAPYHFNRTNDLLKVKKFQDLDLKIIGYFEGENSFANMLGGFIVKYKDNNEVRVGGGYSKDFRIEAWKNPNQFIDKIATIKYFEETSNANGGLSLRFPTFIDIRQDKTEADF